MSITFIPFYPSDFLAGTRGLSAEEVGIYITLLCRMYEMAGPIERDDNRLARLCGMRSTPAFVKLLDFLIDDGKITQSEDGLFNDRAEIEIGKVIGKSVKASQAAQSRWDKKANKNKRRDDANASPKHMPQPCQPKPKPKPKIEADASMGNDDQFELMPEDEQEDPIQTAVDLWNDMAEQQGLSKVKTVSQTRSGQIKNRLKELDGISGWIAALDLVSDSDFLCGRAKNSDWKATFDFLMKPEKLNKVMERGYPPYRSDGPNNNGGGSAAMQAMRDM